MQHVLCAICNKAHIFVEIVLASGISVEPVSTWSTRSLSSAVTFLWCVPPITSKNRASTVGCSSIGTEIITTTVAKEYALQAANHSTTSPIIKETGAIGITTITTTTTIICLKNGFGNRIPRRRYHEHMDIYHLLDFRISRGRRPRGPNFFGIILAVISIMGIIGMDITEAVVGGAMDDTRHRWCPTMGIILAHLDLLRDLLHPQWTMEEIFS